jgi:hypothetical protein
VQQITVSNDSSALDGRHGCQRLGWQAHSQFCAAVGEAAEAAAGDAAAEAAEVGGRVGPGRGLTDRWLCALPLTVRRRLAAGATRLTLRGHGSGGTAFLANSDRAPPARPDGRSHWQSRV